MLQENLKQNTTNLDCYDTGLPNRMQTVIMVEFSGAGTPVEHIYNKCIRVFWQGMVV